MLIPTDLFPVLIGRGQATWLNLPPALQQAAAPTGHGQLRVRVCSKCGGSNWRSASWPGRGCSCETPEWRDE